MAWDPEKYREKREKVLGVRRRGLSFGVVTALVSVTILLGMGALGLPGAVSYIKTLHLEDAIYRLEGNQTWPGEMVSRISSMEGVLKAALDTQNTRLVITFDERRLGTEAFSLLFERENLKAALLNRVGHRQHMVALAREKEAEQ